MFLSVVDLFCGVGGFSLGAAQAGFRPLVGIDIDQDLLSGYHLNFPNSRVVKADLSQMNHEAWTEILRGVRPAGVIGGPPCQGFSRIGKRAENDARNQLIACFIDQVCFLRPAFFVMENVEGLLDTAFEELLEAALKPARKCYELVGPLQINAANLGVPTDRHRVIVVGYDPQRVAKLTEKDFIITNKTNVTVRDAIADLPSPNRRDDGGFGWSRYPCVDSSQSPSAYVGQMKRPLPDGLGWHTALQKQISCEISGFHKTCHSAEVSRRFTKIAPGTTDKISRYLRLSWKGHCPTLRAGTGAERGSFQAARPIHPDHPRVITVREAARLQGFPDAFVFHRTKWHSFRMIGNSVSPPVARNVMAVIRKKIRYLSLNQRPPMANKAKAKKRKADTSPTKVVVVDSLTRDATTEACLFDLVDNAIDGAREALERKAGEKQPAVDLPESYEGFLVKLVISADGVRIEDNASGIAANDLEKSVLRFGQRAGRPHGIGFYGVGLNRALFKLGRLIKIETDDGGSRSILEFDVRDYLKQSSWSRPFDVVESSGRSGTVITLSDPASEISHDLADQDWQEDLRKNLGRRYHRFLQKKLKIAFQGKSVIPVYVPLRENSPFPKLQKSYKSGEDVWIHIEAGEHRDHRFPAELAKGQSNPPELTRDFGWSVICNDREILEADRSEKTGWEPTWHNEYNGFVGRVHFISTSPQLLPWNTSKTDVDRNNVAYRRALKDMQGFAHKWRQYTRAAKTAKRRGQPLPIPNTRKAPLTKPIVLKGGGTGARPHARSVVPADIDEGKCSGKILELVREGKAIDLFENRYTGLVMLRILFEIASIHFLQRKKLLEPCRNWCLTKEETSRGKPFNKDQRKKYMPGLAVLLDYFTEHWTEAIDPSAAAYLEAGYRKFKQFKPEMDNAVHHPFHETNALRAIEMRDSVIPILRHLIET